MIWSKYSAPQAFYPLAGRLIPWFAAVAVILMVVGLYMGFFVAPTDFQQGESYRIIFVHVPAAWMSMFLYVVMAIWAGVGMGLNARLSFMMAQAIAPTGAMFTFLALLTGAMWGKPTWGAWWVWDARLTSELILLFQYAGVMLLRTSIDDLRRADRSSAVFALVGVVNVPIIYYSVQWWTMLMAMLIMTIAFWMYSIAVILARVRCVMVERESLPTWDDKPAAMPEAVEAR
ncbi:MAG: cytochrome c biogenesis protein CcsA [Nitrospira sp.]